ncbi:25S rRNA (adenine645-N1)-methyltransferase [Mycoblastus sanguinarius]|nr:25S rRNA (adenine645-N1)-methyltransferase [Mycoblastus sanguinarius]
MFAVPGWSLSADTLKAQVDPKASKALVNSNPDKQNGTDKKSKKRKRGKIVEVTEENLGDLWKKYVEEKGLGSVDRGIASNETRQKKKRRKGKENGGEEALEMTEDVFEGFSEGEGKIGFKKEEEPVENISKRPDTAVQVNGHAPKKDESPIALKDHGQPGDGKSKYEQRKAKASEKREQKALLQANGTLPPSRPDPPSNDAKKTAQSKPPKPSKAATTPPELPPAKSIDAPKTLNSPKLSEAPNAAKSATSQKDPAPSAPTTTTTLTPLQQRMAAKLTSARFRHLNQTLYTSPSDQSMRLFTDSPQAYTSYHAGFRAQVAVWPQNPVKVFIEEVKLRGRASVPSQKKLWREQKKGKKKGTEAINNDATNVIPTPESSPPDPLPRSRNGNCTIADLGCGDAHLAASLSTLSKPLSLNILSFDLAKGDTPNAHLITVADITSLSPIGIKDGSVDVAVLCLALMGTNWVDVVGECARIVRAGGEVWVAEIKSRFGRPGPKKQMAESKGKKKAKPGRMDDGVDEELADLAEVEEVGGKGKKNETDVSAFVEVFKKRGFTLKGEADMSNKMFVRMQFVKTLKPENGRGGGEPLGRDGAGRGTDMGRAYMGGKMKFVEDEGEEVDESKVLKPCVYKRR